MPDTRPPLREVTQWFLAGREDGIPGDCIRAVEHGTDRLPAFGLAIGPSPRGHSHAVVVRDGKIAWDPHPSRDGLLDVQQVIEFTEPGAYAWGQSVAVNTAAGVIDIPIDDGGLTVGTVRVGVDDARVLYRMLGDALMHAGGGHD